jgi:hypothetical protein
VHNISDVRQIEVHMAEPLLPGPSRLDVEIPIAKLKKYESPGIDELPAELIQAGGDVRSTNSLILFRIRKKYLEGVYQFKKRGNRTDCNNYCGISLGLPYVQD